MLGLGWNDTIGYILTGTVCLKFLSFVHNDLLSPGESAVITRTVLGKDGTEETIRWYVTYRTKHLTDTQRALLREGDDLNLMSFYAEYGDSLIEDNSLRNLCSSKYSDQERFQSLVSGTRRYLESFESKFRERFGNYIDELNVSFSINTDDIPHYRKEVLRQQAMISDASNHAHDLLSRLDLGGSGEGIPYGTRETMRATHILLGKSFDRVVLIDYKDEDTMLSRFYSLSDLEEILDAEMGRIRGILEKQGLGYLENLEELAASASDAWYRFVESLPWDEAPVLSWVMILVVALTPLVWGTALLLMVTKRLILRVGKWLSGIVAQVIEEKETVKFRFVTQVLKLLGLILTFLSSLFLTDWYDLLPDPVGTMVRRLKSAHPIEYLGMEDALRYWFAYLGGFEHLFPLMLICASFLMGSMVYLGILTRRILRERRAGKVKGVVIKGSVDGRITGNDRAKVTDASAGTIVPDRDIRVVDALPAEVNDDPVPGITESMGEKVDKITDNLSMGGNLPADSIEDMPDDSDVKDVTDSDRADIPNGTGRG